MNLTQEIVASANRYSLAVLRQLEPLGISHEVQEVISKLMHGAYISGIATVAAAQCAHDGSEILSPGAVVRACDESAVVLGIREGVSR